MMEPVEKEEVLPFINFRQSEESLKLREPCGCCDGTGLVRDANMHYDSNEACMTCCGKGYFTYSA